MWNRTLVYFGIAEEDEEEWDEDGYVTNEELERTYSERPNVRRLQTRRRNNRDFDDWTDPEPAPARTATLRQRSRPELAPVPAQSNAAVRVHLVVPRSFNDAQTIADRFKDYTPVILNLQGVDSELSKRLIDFASGLTYALDGGMQRIADGLPATHRPTSRSRRSSAPSSWSAAASSTRPKPARLLRLARAACRRRVLPRLPTVTSVSPAGSRPAAAPRDRLRLAQDGDDRDAVLRTKLSLGERLADPGLVSGTATHSIWSSPSAISRSSTILGRSYAAKEGAKLTRLVVVERDHGGGVLVVRAPEPVELSLAVVVQDERDAAAGIQPEAVLDADTR